MAQVVSTKLWLNKDLVNTFLIIDIRILNSDLPSVCNTQFFSCVISLMFQRTILQPLELYKKMSTKPIIFLCLLV